MKNIIKIFILSLIITSCGEFEEVIYDNVNGQPYASFNESSSSLAVTVDDTGSVDIKISVSTISVTPRTINVSLIASSTTADAANYSFNPVVTIPANEYFAILTVTGTDVTVDTAPENIALKLDSVDGGVVSTSIHNVSIFQVCPINAPFTGMYLITQTSALIDGATLGDGTIVELTAPSETQRSFDTPNYPLYCAAPSAFVFNMVCNELIVPVQNNSCPCTSGTDWFGPAATPENYDPNDDTSFSLTFADDQLGDCGAVAYTTYLFTKQ